MQTARMERKKNLTNRLIPDSLRSQRQSDINVYRYYRYGRKSRGKDRGHSFIARNERGLKVVRRKWAGTTEAEQERGDAGSGEDKE